MENPNSWNKVQKLISIAFNEYMDDVIKGVIGCSETMYVYNKLKENHYLRTDEEAREELEYFNNNKVGE